MQATHFADILLSTHRMNHRATSQEHQGFKKRMRHHMKHSRHIISGSYGQEHKAELTHRRVCQYFFNVVLFQCNGRCKKSGRQSNNRYYLLGNDG